MKPISAYLLLVGGRRYWVKIRRSTSFLRLKFAYLNAFLWTGRVLGNALYQIYITVTLAGNLFLGVTTPIAKAGSKERVRRLASGESQEKTR